ncbi:probable leucine-rich repeat receptor-like protein kinase At5g49770 [Ananas comosus]|uniref:non-specific serine/threonine protein kinase n=1 Tax=Ananas comosus TaxID=4615 RepID=A0A6P5ER17_ANACO|nr:probable leucine-rich repeat receptor-like protein kinase At5g49770 [Ananas comosus]
MVMRSLLLLFLCVTCSAYTNPSDVSALKSLMKQWKNTPPSWQQSKDPCGERWDGVICTNSRVTTLKLFSMGLEGTLSDDIGKLDQLQTLDLSYNHKLGGPLTPAIGNLTQLTSLILVKCSFTGSIPDELGNLRQLTFLALNSNKFIGRIPATLGKLSNISWLDLADNQLNGTLPLSTNASSGLDQLLNAQHFHLNKNQLSGSIPKNLFNASMTLRHLLLDRNQLIGGIPESVGLVASLEILRLNNNNLTGTVPSSIRNLPHLHVLNISNNNLNGQMPNLTGMTRLQNVDISNNKFDPSEVPSWLTGLTGLRTLMMQSARLHGQVPQELFSFPGLEKVMLDNNELNGTLDMSNNISKNLQIVSFENNSINSITLSSNYNNTLILSGNPVCSNPHLLNTAYCEIQQETLTPSSSDNITCSHPYEGVMMFRAPSFGIMLDEFISKLEANVAANLSCTPHSLTLEDPFFDEDGYLEVKLVICPSNKNYFNRSEILDCFDISSQKFIPPEMFGPYYLSANPYSFQNRVIRGLAIGMIIGFSLLLIGLVALLLFALRQKKQAQRAISLSNPFASWVSNGEESDGAPQLSGAKCFTYDELKRSTNDFRGINEIGSGGYGKVYKGMLPDGRIVAIKRSQQGSNQGGLEFKTEIELLSRVHHKNLVELVGFCCEKGELILVYEFMSNGTIRETLSGRSGIQLDWTRRLRIALDSARGLTYLHEHANPPIIHRDVKSSNILLDEKLTAKVGDFGLSLLVADSEMGHFTTNIKGTLGYLDPEYYMTQQLTGKSDVYSMGVVLLELITAMLPVHNKKHIVNHVKIALDKQDKEFCGLKSIIDPVISNSGKLVGFESFVDLALQCVEESAENRPTMSDVVKEIEAILRNNGMKTTSTSESSSPADFTSSKARYPYDDLYSRSHASSSAFAYSGGFPSRGSSRPSSS